MQKHALSIWFFIGLLLAIYGVLILAAGLYDYFVPPAVPLALANYHAGIWWGLLMIIVGGTYLYCFRPKPDQDTHILSDE